MLSQKYRETSAKEHRCDVALWSESSYKKKIIRNSGANTQTQSTQTRVGSQPGWTWKATTVPNLQFAFHVVPSSIRLPEKCISRLRKRQRGWRVSA